MWEYMRNQCLYAKINDKHCSVWYDVYIHEWRWTTVALTVNRGIVMRKGKCPTASSAMINAEKDAENVNE